jgi:hypothetical protein
MATKYDTELERFQIIKNLLKRDSNEIINIKMIQMEDTSAVQKR